MFAIKSKQTWAFEEDEEEKGFIYSKLLFSSSLSNVSNKRLKFTDLSAVNNDYQVNKYDAK